MDPGRSTSAKEPLPAEHKPQRPRGALRDALITAGLELARTGGPEAVVLREATRRVGVVPNAAYRHFADRGQLLAEVCAAAMTELTERIRAGIASVPGDRDDPLAAGNRLRAIGAAYLEFAHEEPGLFATAFALPHEHAYAAQGTEGEWGTGGTLSPTPLGLLRAALDELVETGALAKELRDGAEYPIWSAIHGLAALTGRGPLRDIPTSSRGRLERLTFTFIEHALRGNGS